MALLRPPPVKPASATLAERIDAINAEVEALIQDRIAAEKAANPGIPEQSLRQMFDAKYGRCKCLAFKQFSDPEKFAADQQAKRMETFLRETREAAASMGE